MKGVLATKPNIWSDRLYQELSEDENIEWIRISYASEYEKISETNPEWTFFFHWSKLVPEEIYNKHRCVVVHTSNLPDGKGGSPLQNQIIDGIIKSKVNTIAMAQELDSGPVYCSQEITLQGDIFDIWSCIASVAKELIEKCIYENVIPVEQEEGRGKKYKRRKDNTLPTNKEDNLYHLYRHIQMLDGEGYPNSSLKVGDFVFSFSRAKHFGEEVLCDVRIRKSE